VFLLGLFFGRLNAAGAMASLIGGFVLGMGRIALEQMKDDLSGVLYTFATINFLNFAALLFLVCSGILVLVSLMTPPPPEEKVRGLTFATAGEDVAGVPQAELDRAISDPAWRRKDAMLSGVTIVLVGLVMIYFSSLFF